MMYKELTVGEKEYKCRLSAKNAIALEDKLGKNPVAVLTGGDMPSLKEILTIFHATLQEFEHGITFDKACAIYDEYCEEEGHDQTSFFWFLLKVLQVNGYVSKEVDFDELERQGNEETEKQIKDLTEKN